MYRLELSLLREKQFLQYAFDRYLPEQVVIEVLKQPKLSQLGGEQRVVSILFFDIADFTTISERMTPQDLVRLLNRCMTEMTKIIQSEGGIIDKYQGDGLMAEFGIPLHLLNSADSAVSAALQMIQRLRIMNLDPESESESDKLPLLRCRIGINTGAAVVGNIGSESVYDYTVIGDAANVASRLESENKNHRTELLVSEATYRRLTPDRFLARSLGTIPVRGRKVPVSVYEIRAERERAPHQERKTGADQNGAKTGG